MLIRRAEAADAQGIAEVHLRVWQIGYAPFIESDYTQTLSLRTNTMRWLASLADPLHADTLVAIEDGCIRRLDELRRQPQRPGYRGGRGLRALRRPGLVG
jgi:hypothetical protein